MHDRNIVVPTFPTVRLVDFVRRSDNLIEEQVNMTIDAAVPAPARSINLSLGEPETITLRPSMAADHSDLFAIFASTRADEFAALDWPPDRVAALLADQFRLQDTYYRRHYADAHFDVILCGGKVIGRLYHNWSDTELRIIDIALLPKWRGCGIGTRLMHGLVSVAAQRDMAVSLYVETDNPVRALYERLGFRMVGDEGAYLFLRRPFDAGRLPSLPEQDVLNELFQSTTVMPCVTS
jgi:ribosomal protein S18 acetylase RimI-like enzyme